MRKLSFISSIVFSSAALISVASAADMPVKARPAPSASCTWCGLYAGIHAGYGWSEVDASIFGFGLTPAPEPTGGFGGVQIGYNWMVNPTWLIGFETDLSIASIKDTKTLFAFGPVSLDAKSELEYFGTARARVGYVQGDWLLYGTAGLAWGRNRVTSNLNLFGLAALPLVHDYEYHVGWTAGAGAEWKVGSNWSVKAEYLYADLGQQDYPTIISTAFVPPVRHEQTMHTVKVGLNYLVGSDNAPAANLPAKAKAALPSCAWCGGYAGVHAGYGWSSIESSIGGFAINPRPEPAGGFGGFQFGYNWIVAPNWLVGLETDLSIGGIKDTVTLLSFGPLSIDASSELEYFGTARGRVGYVNDAWLFYGTGGLAWGRNQITSNVNIAGFAAIPIVDNHQYHVGWTIGAGAEWMFRQHWTAKIEYLYADLGAQDYPTIISTALVPPVHRTQDLQTIKLGLNYKL